MRSRGHDVLLATGGRENPERYVAALKGAGIDAQRIRIVVPGPEVNRDAATIAAGAAGLVLSGGADLHPRHFGEEVVPEARLYIEEERDELELALLAGAREAKVPVWGVCRGLQVLNVFLGGSLWLDLPSQVPGSLLHDLSFPADALVHEVRVEATTGPLGEVLSRELALVNSRHHQGVKVLAPGVRVIGRAPDGLVEAMSLEAEDWWVHAVQWHPENLIPMAQQRALWQRFADAIAARDALQGEAAPAPAAAGESGP